MKRINWRWVTICGALLAATSAPWAAYGDSPDALKAKLISVWEAAPALDEDLLQAKPDQNFPYIRAYAIGTRESYNFTDDGKCTILITHRLGPEDGTTIDRLVTDTIKADWAVVSGDPKVVKIRVTRQPLKPGTAAKPVEQTLNFDGNDTFSMDVFDMLERGFRSPFVFHRNVGDCATQWIARNCTGSTKSQFVQDMNGAIAKYVKADHDFSLCLGGHFTKSGKATEIQGFSGKLFVFEMTKAQAADMHLGDDQVQLLDTPHQDVFPVLTEARIDKVELSNRGTLDLSQPITGKVTVSPLHTLGDSGDYSVRMTCQTAQARFSMFCPIPSGPGTQATYDCKFKAADRNAQYAGPLTIIVDFCRTTRFGQGNFSVEVLSNSYSTVVDAKPAK